MLNKIFKNKLTPLVKNKLNDELKEKSWELQFSYSDLEEEIKEYELNDPIGDSIHKKVKGLIHRYSNRVLVLLTQTCPIHCRFCFRKDVIGSSGLLTENEWEQILEYLKKHEEVDEIIFSGGDPLAISASKLSYYLDTLESINHLQIIRFHTRVLTLSPEMINCDILQVLKKSTLSKTVYIMAHINHQDEISDQAKMAIKKLQSIQISILCQSVLLKNLNDTHEELISLYKKLIQLQVMPIYLHQLDPSPGTSHFRVPIKKGQELIKGLQGKLPGYAIPKYILDMPDGSGKIPIHESFFKEMEPKIESFQIY